MLSVCCLFCCALLTHCWSLCLKKPSPRPAFCGEGNRTEAITGPYPGKGVIDKEENRGRAKNRGTTIRLKIPFKESAIAGGLVWFPVRKKIHRFRRLNYVPALSSWSKFLRPLAALLFVLGYLAEEQTKESP
uniref:Putative secreted protein n=1 Tax=Anopheles triannulatus TaxID=58253 RepID=A0A2M4B0K7_9DIPT